MTQQEFDAILEKRIETIRSTLAGKAKEYAVGDRLYNFKRGAEILRTTPEKALLGLFVKHLVSVIDLVEGSIPVTEYLINEKIGDAINYLILLEAMMKEDDDASFHRWVSSVIGKDIVTIKREGQDDSQIH